MEEEKVEVKQVCFLYNAIATFYDRDGNKTEKNKMIWAKHPSGAMKKAKSTFIEPEMEEIPHKDFGKDCVKACRQVKQSVPETIVLIKMEVENAD